MARFLNTNEPTGGLNFDDDIEGAAIPFPPTDYTYSLNTRVGGRDDRYFNARKNIPGNKILSYNLPTGNNQVIGYFEDKGGQSIIYFIWNSNLEHQILRWFQTLNEIQLIAKGQIFNFDTDHLITGIGLVDGKLLNWTDGMPDKNTITGNPPRSMNIVRSNITRKKLCYNVYVGIPGNQFDIGDTVTITLIKPDGTAAINNYTVFTSPSLKGNLKEGFKQLADKINTDPIANVWLEAEACGECHMKVCLKVEGDYFLSLLHPAGGWRLLTVPDNFLYGAYFPLKEEHITQIKSPPSCQPNISYGSDSTRPSNLVAGIQFQFAVRYIYYDHEKTTISPISGISIEDLLCGTDVTQSPNNFINIDFTEARLSDPQFLEMIRGVEILVREGNDGLWKSVKILEPCEIGIDKQVFKFYNDGQYPVLSLTDTERPYDYVPLIAGGLEIVNNRKFEGGFLENYDNIDCVDAKLEVTYDPIEECDDTKLWDIIGKIEILNPFFSGAYAGYQPILNYGNAGQGKVCFGGIIDDNDFVGGLEADYHQYLPATGFIPYLAGTTHRDISKQNDPGNGVTFLGNNVYEAYTGGHRDKIRAAIKDNGKVYSTFRIKGVKPGKYILRMASHLCDVGGTYGKKYDLNNGLEWQKTSTNVAGMGSASNGLQEIVLDLPSGGGTADIGFIGIYDLSNEGGTASPRSNNHVATGYVIDDESKSALSDLKLAPRMERQLFYDDGQGGGFYVHSPDQNNATVTVGIALGYTDHNGYFYYARKFVTNYPLPQPTTMIPLVFVSVPAGTASNLSIRQTGQTIYRDSGVGVLQGLEDGTLTLEGDINLKGEERSYIVYNHNPVVSTDCRTYVEGFVENFNNAAVPGIKVQITKVGRVDEFTDNTGHFKILIYGEPRPDSSKNTRSESVLYRVNEACCSSVFPALVPFIIPQFIHNADYSFDHHYPVALLQILFNAFSVKNGWKHRNRVTTGIAYYDLYNRSSKVQPVPELYIPFFTEPGGNFGIPVLNWLINHKPPEWATHYQWVRILNPLYNRYTQFVANSIQYVRSFDRLTTTPAVTTFTAGDATEIYISLEAFNIFTDENTGNVISYTFEPGDRIAFIKDDKNQPYKELFDFAIEGIRTFGGQVAIAIKLNESLPELKQGAMFELYTPKRVATEEIYFEFSECYEVLNPHTANRVHGKGFLGQDQTTTQPATGTFKGGDTYYKIRHIPTGSPKVYFDRLMESEYVFDNIATSKQQNIGRPNNIDKDFKQTFFKSWIRFSRRYLPDSLVNGLSSFFYADKIEIDENFGSIMKLTFVDTVMLSIHQFKIQPLYMELQPILGLDGQQQLTATEKVATKAQPLQQDWGTHNPESVVIESGQCYGWDIFKGLVWRYAGDGLTAISDYKAKKYFDDKSRTLYALPRTQTRCFSTYDRKNDELVMAFSQSIFIPPSPVPVPIVIPPETISFSEPRNRWDTFYSYSPEFFGRLAKQTVAFKDGQIWFQENGTRNNFFGQQAGSKITIAANAEPQALKHYRALRYKSNHRWSMTAEILRNSSYPNGMKTRLTKTNFQLKEGDFWGNFLRDLSDPNFTSQLEALQRGRELVGSVMLVTLTNDDTDEVILRRIDVISDKSMITM